MSTLPGKELPLVMLGAGGHAKVLLSLAQASGLEVVGICDLELSQHKGMQWRGIQVLGGDDALDAFEPGSIGLINGIGQTVGGEGRRRLFERLSGKGFVFPALVHPSAWVDASATLGEGVQVMAGAVIQADVVVSCNSIINTCASVDHDCRLGEHVHVAPGATLCGNVKVGDLAFIGSGATVIQGVSVGECAIVGAAAVLVRDLPAGHTLIGTAARRQY
ncbi:acetyltransferase [Pseudomonas sp. Rh2]|uniref:acetyltransferase n=1 Tax=unclassified Pseudomonas TaxID=196821 RepID=UPI00345D692A